MTLRHARPAVRTSADSPTVDCDPAPPQVGRQQRRRHWGGPVVGGFYLSMGGAHIGLVAGDTEVYRSFADAAFFAFVRDGWANVFMAQPVAFGLLLAAGEITLGVLLLIGGRAATAGWTGVIVFHLLLMLFGFGTWVWCVPALVVLVLLARRDNSRSLTGRSPLR